MIRQSLLMRVAKIDPRRIGVRGMMSDRHRTIMQVQLTPLVCDVSKCEHKMRNFLSNSDFLSWVPKSLYL